MSNIRRHMIANVRRLHIINSYFQLSNMVSNYKKLPKKYIKEYHGYILGVIQS